MGVQRELHGKGLSLIDPWSGDGAPQGVQLPKASSSKATVPVMPYCHQGHPGSSVRKIKFRYKCSKAGINEEMGVGCMLMRQRGQI